MLIRIEDYLDVQEQIKEEYIPSGFQTTNVSGLDLTFPSQDEIDYSDTNSSSSNSDMLELEDMLKDIELHYPAMPDYKDMGPITNHLMCGYNLENITMLSDFVVSHGMRELECLDKVDVSALKTYQNENQPPRYQIIGDNVDLYIKVKHMASDNQNRSVHWFGLNAVQDRVYLEAPSSRSQIRPILDVDNSEFLPSDEDNNRLLHDFIPLAARVIVDKIPTFSPLKNVVVRHIPHMYSQQMKQKSVQVSICFFLT